MTKQNIWFVLVAVVLFAGFSLYRERLISRHASPDEQAVLLTGDEPHYLLTALALARGDGLDIGPAHQERDFERFQPKRIFRKDYEFSWRDYRERGFQSMLDKSAQWGDRRYSIFSPLPSLLVAPWFLTGLSPVRWYALVTQALVMALVLAWLLWRLHPVDGRAWWRGGFVLLAGAVGIPSGYYVSQLFPEALSGMLLLAGVACFQANATSRTRALGGLLISMPIWATPRVLPAVGLVFLWSLFSRRPAARQEALVIAVNLLLYAIFCLWLWGNPVAPQASSMLFRLYRAMPVWGFAVGLAFVLGGVWLWRRGLRWPRGVGWWLLLIPALLAAWLVPALHARVVDIVAYFLTRQIGLLVLNPFLLAGLYAAWWWHRQEPGAAFNRWLLLFVGVVLAVVFYPDRRAGTCPAGRYQVMASLLLVYPLVRAAVLSTPQQLRAWWPGALVLGSASLVISFFSALKPNYWFRNYPAIFGYQRVTPFYEHMPTASEPDFLVRAAIALAFLILVFWLPGWLAGRWAKRAA